MTPDEIEAERERFQEAWYQSVADQQHPPAAFFQMSRGKYLSASVECDWHGWQRRAEIARAEQAELRAENERLRERVRELEQQIATMRANGFVATASSGDSGATFREFPIIIQERSW